MTVQTVLMSQTELLLQRGPKFDFLESGLCLPLAATHLSCVCGCWTYWHIAACGSCVRCCEPQPERGEHTIANFELALTSAE